MDRHNEPNREDFEQFAQNLLRTTNESADFSRDGKGDYINPKIQDMWNFKRALTAWSPPLKALSEAQCEISAQRGEGGETLYNYYCPKCQQYLGETYDKESVPTKSEGRNMCEKCTGSAQAEPTKAAVQLPKAPEGYALVPIAGLKAVHRDLDACQKVIWLAGVGNRGYGFDPSYCEDAQARLKEIEEWIAPEHP